MTARPVPDPDDASAPFWEACAEHRLVIQKCSTCNAFRHPPRPMCPRCRSFGHTFEPASGRARIWSWVIAHPPVLPVFQDVAPYPVIVAELDEGVRMIGRLLDADKDSIAMDQEVVVEWEDVEPGVSLAAWRRA